MAPGDWHELHGYRFQETLHGPFLGAECADCGGFCVAAPDYPNPRCELCLQKYMGVPPVHVRMAAQIRPARWLNPIGLGHSPAPTFNLKGADDDDMPAVQ